MGSRAKHAAVYAEDPDSKTPECTSAVDILGRGDLQLVTMHLQALARSAQCDAIDRRCRWCDGGGALKALATRSEGAAGQR